MNGSGIAEVARWSTRDLPATQRLDVWADVLTSAMIPLYVRASKPREFESSMSVVACGPLTVVRQSGTPHACGRGRSELARSGQRQYHLMMSLNNTYHVSHRNDLCLAPGDLVLVDSDLICGIDLVRWYEFLNIGIPVEWLKRWVPDAGALVGRRIPGNSNWGAALAAYLVQLLPDAVTNAPIPRSVLADQVGALLALIAHEMSGQEPRNRPADRSLRDRVSDCLAQRCHEHGLTAEAVADSLGISVRTLHRALVGCQQTFADQLLDARLNCALRMLESKIFSRMTVGEIGRRAGFADASHFTRVVRRRLGVTPLQLRTRSGTETGDTAARSAAEGDGHQS
ncbi:AraC family transcriptional regulator [Paraburkholderia sp. CNPSo 3274]|uniref:helix-turn-helix transcriptional regulator n=1 Tax=Paraburkholderia sp. CNPSo 3274 TaxID=2940932 RepID=UPI0020B70FE2|nr:AraC family transcriptional regulator [Paraburkholderia sp. CNPSo 3274]MCP3705595.1 AraC family transcriptional regulator [Paraburkholderia sp. CNPSo 3274]